MPTHPIRRRIDDGSKQWPSIKMLEGDDHFVDAGNGRAPTDRLFKAMNETHFNLFRLVLKLTMCFDPLIWMVDIKQSFSVLVDKSQSQLDK